MQGQKLQARSKANSKGVGTKKGKETKMAKQKIIDLQIDSENIKEYFENLKSKISSFSSSLQPKIEVLKLFKAFKKMPTQTLAILVQLYLSFPSVFYQYTKDSTAQQNEVRPICQFLHLILKNIANFPFMQRQKTITIYQNILKWLQQKSTFLNEKQLLLINQGRSSLCTIIVEGEIDRLVENSFMFLLKLTLNLGEKARKQVQFDCWEENIGALMVTIAYIFQSNKKIASDVQSTILDFHKNSFRILIINVLNPIKIYPFFDIATMCFTSKKGDICKKIINQTFSMLKILIDERRQQIRQSTDQKSLQDAQHKINGILLVSSFLKFDSIFQPSILSKKAMLMKQVTLLTLVNFKPSIIKLVDQLQKLQKTAIPPQIVRGMFQISKYCNNINKQNVLPSIVNRIMSHRQLSAHLLNDQKIVYSPKQQETLQTINKNLQKYLFQIMYRIQKTLCHYNLQVFVDLYVEHPLTFRSEYFVQQTFKNQHEQVILNFMKALTSKWLLVDIKIFDFTFYLLHFIKKCIIQDKIGTLGRFLNQIKIEELTRINLMVYKLSFEEDKKKYAIPDCCYGVSQLSSITSAGYAEKYFYVNQMMPSFSQQLLWKRFVGQMANSNHYFVVKSFYSVVNYQWIVDEGYYEKVDKLVGYFQECINTQQMEEMYSTFHLLYCILFTFSGKINTEQSSQKMHINTKDTKLKDKCCGRLLQIIVNKSDSIVNMYDLVCNRRRAAMKTVVLSSQMVSENLRYFQNLRKMNTSFLKSIHKWSQSLTNIKQLITSKQSYQTIIQIFLQFCKNYEYRQYHQIRYLSYYCSQKYFNNIIFMKIKTKITKREMLPSNNLMVLKEIIDHFIGKYQGEEICNQYCIVETEVMGYYAFILGFQIEVVNQREILKSKIIVLQQIVELNRFFEEHPNHQHFDEYHQLFHQNIKNTIIEIVHQNPLYVSKYERQFMLHLRTIALKQILRNISTYFQILDLQHSYQLVFQSCFDKNIQIRFLILNILSSRFKADLYRRFLSDKYQIAVFFTIICIFDANVSLSSVAKKMIQRFKQAGKDCYFLGLIIMLYSIKNILTYCGRNYRKEEYCTFVDHFISNFEKLWLMEKETEYMSYLFSTQFIEEGRMQFILNIPWKQSYIQPYNITKSRTDFLLQNEIKQYLRKQQQYSFQLPSQQQSPTFKQKLINEMIQSLPYRIFSKVKRVIQQKPRNTRILRYKKDVMINWKMLEEKKLIRNYQERNKIDVVKLSL